MYVTDKKRRTVRLQSDDEDGGSDREGATAQEPAPTTAPQDSDSDEGVARLVLLLLNAIYLRSDRDVHYCVWSDIVLFYLDANVVPTCVIVRFSGLV